MTYGNRFKRGTRFHKQVQTQRDVRPRRDTPCEGPGPEDVVRGRKKNTFFKLCEVIFLLRLLGKFYIDHSSGVKGLMTVKARPCLWDVKKRERFWPRERQAATQKRLIRSRAQAIPGHATSRYEVASCLLSLPSVFQNSGVGFLAFWNIVRHAFRMSTFHLRHFTLVGARGLRGVLIIF